MGLFTSKATFKEGSETRIKNLIESLLLSPETVIEIDFINAKFYLYNLPEKTSIAIDSLGVKTDISVVEENKTKIIALDSKFTDTQLTYLKDIIAKEATIRRDSTMEKTFVNRAEALTETINSLQSKWKIQL